MEALQNYNSSVIQSINQEQEQKQEQKQEQEQEQQQQLLLLLLLLLILHPINGLFSRITCISRHLKGRRILGFNDSKDDGVTVTSNKPYANLLHFAPDR